MLSPYDDRRHIGFDEIWACDHLNPTITLRSRLTLLSVWDPEPWPPYWAVSPEHNQHLATGWRHTLSGVKGTKVQKPIREKQDDGKIGNLYYWRDETVAFRLSHGISHFTRSITVQRINNTAVVWHSELNFFPYCCMKYNKCILIFWLPPPPFFHIRRFIK